MTRILVAGLINYETIVGVDEFPVDYKPVRYPFHRIRGSVSGVGYNVAKALTMLGDPVRFLSLTGRDPASAVVRDALLRDNIDSSHILNVMDETPQSVILCDDSGRRAINVDLKNIQDTSFPVERFAEALDGCDMAVLCNINFSRPLLAIASARGVPIATDVHCVSDLDDSYNRDYMAAATVLFMSGESLPCDPEEWLRRLTAQYRNEIVVIGLGASGALLFDSRRQTLVRMPAVPTRPIRNATGAGDALFSCFVHYHARGEEPEAALHKAMIFASWKLGGRGGADGFLTEGELEAKYCAIRHGAHQVIV